MLIGVKVGGCEPLVLLGGYKPSLGDELVDTNDRKLCEMFEQVFGLESSGTMRQRKY